MLSVADRVVKLLAECVGSVFTTAASQLWLLPRTDSNACTPRQDVPVPISKLLRLRATAWSVRSVLSDILFYVQHVRTHTPRYTCTTLYTPRYHILRSMYNLSTALPVSAALLLYYFLLPAAGFSTVHTKIPMDSYIQHI